jgi:vancomycin permeability regulator SanA
MQRSRKRRGRRGVLIRGIVAIALLFMTGAAGIIGSEALTLKRAAADVAIVFGNKVEPSGRPSKRLAARLEAARLLYRDGRVRTIFASGGTGVEGFDESRVMKEWLVTRGVPDSAVVADPNGVTTASTCANAERWMAARRCRTADVVSQWFHLRRARLACESAGIDVVGGASARYTEPRDVYALGREVVALWSYALRPRHGD